MTALDMTSDDHVSHSPEADGTFATELTEQGASAGRHNTRHEQATTEPEHSALRLTARPMWWSAR